jgi:hypothetical protein
MAFGLASELSLNANANKFTTGHRFGALYRIIRSNLRAAVLDFL